MARPGRQKPVPPRQQEPDVSMKHGILALLEDGPSHGYQLKHEFESRTGGAWLINVGQVYTTLQRLERDGLVAPLDDEGRDRRVFGITDQGRKVLATWFAEPTTPSAPPRDELAIKVLLAIAAEHVDVTAVLQGQRTATLEQMQEYARAKQAADPERELPWLLLLDALTLKAEAEIRWLDVCEARLRQRPRHNLPDLASPAGGASDAKHFGRRGGR
jgi:DNA-binding PadR family transcriptional regulator